MPNNQDARIDSLTTVMKFKEDCETFKRRIKKGRDVLVTATTAVHEGWKDEDFNTVKKMVDAIEVKVNDIAASVSKSVLPFVQGKIDILTKKPT